MQPVGRRGKGWGLLRVRQVRATASEPGWHLHLRDKGITCRGQECVRGQLRVRRVHGRLRGPLPAALRAATTTASTTSSTASFAAAVTATAVTTTAISAASTASFAAAVTATAVTATAISAASAAARSADMRVQHNACRWWRWFQYQRHCNYHVH